MVFNLSYCFFIHFNSYIILITDIRFQKKTILHLSSDTWMMNFWIRNQLKIASDRFLCPGLVAIGSPNHSFPMVSDGLPQAIASSTTVGSGSELVLRQRYQTLSRMLIIINSLAETLGDSNSSTYSSPSRHSPLEATELVIAPKSVSQLHRKSPCLPRHVGSPPWRNLWGTNFFHALRLPSDDRSHCPLRYRLTDPLW